MDRNTRTLVVEDEGLVALELQDKLISVGYDVLDVATSSDEAFRGVVTSKPDIVLMGVCLRGQRDGIQTAQEIRHHSQLPIIFVTANADPSTLQRARCSLPSGFFVKPIQFASLTSSIEMAIYKARMEQYEVWRKSLESSTDDIIFVTDTAGSVEFLNASAKRLIGPHDASGLDSHEQQLRSEQRLIAEGHFASGVRETLYTLFRLIGDRDAPGKPFDPVLETEIPDASSFVSQLQLACEIGMGVAQQLASFASKQPQPFELINVNQFIARNALMFQNLLGDNVKRNKSLCSDASIVRMPLHNLAQILMNILISAKRKLAGSGTIHLTTAIVPEVRDNLRLDFRLERAGPGAWTPFGFPFEPEAFDSEISVANAIVASAEGSLHYEQRWANTAHVVVLLPRVESVQQLQSHIPSQKPLVLLIGAGEETARALEQQLKTSGFRIIRSASALEALIVAQFHQGHISAVVGDAEALSPRWRERGQRAFLDRNPRHQVYLANI
jgi:CheY-like chemotaxis protein